MFFDDHFTATEAREIVKTRIEKCRNGIQKMINQNIKERCNMTETEFVLTVEDLPCSCLKHHSSFGGFDINADLKCVYDHFKGMGFQVKITDMEEWANYGRLATFSW